MIKQFVVSLWAIAINLRGIGVMILLGVVCITVWMLPFLSIFFIFLPVLCLRLQLMILPLIFHYPRSQSYWSLSLQNHRSLLLQSHSSLVSSHQPLFLGRFMFVTLALIPLLISPLSQAMHVIFLSLLSILMHLLLILMRLKVLSQLFYLMRHCQWRMII
ncbi:unnamed protein product [Ilex paraguariensis]|uniref:NADH dehydrogenase subunit 2 n=1 Tax=Ilex paraguariensis TaxID=185542 RepID=A0ABC8QP81_9AQUA